MTKICGDCKVSKPVSEFYTRAKSDPKPNFPKSFCKVCDNLRNKKNKKSLLLRNPERVRAYNRFKKKEFYQRHKEAIDLKTRKENATHCGYARKMLRNAVARGKIIRPLNCERCRRSDYKIQGHHEDYSKPLDVQWLCTLCHNYVHRVKRSLAATLPESLF